MGQTVLPMIDWETKLGTLRARLQGRSWWAVRFTDGTVVHEFDSDPGSPNKHADWGRLKLQGRQAIRLFCPDGQVAELGGTTDNTGRLVQFKVAVRTAGSGEGTLAHVIGLVTGTDGQATFYSWELQEDGSGRLAGPWDDNVNAMKYHNVGRLAADHIGFSQ